MIAPPTMEVDNKPDAWVVYFFSPCTDKEKIVANIIELNIPTLIILHTARLPVELIEKIIKKTDMAAQVANTIFGFNDCKIKAPTNRPINMPPQ